MEKDQGVMSIKCESCYLDIVRTLVGNGYEVTVSYDRTMNIITIKYKKNGMED